MPPIEETLKDEFQLIQKKLDNIGEYKFRVRGWSLTLQTGIVVALFSGKVTENISGNQVVVLGLPALVVILLFHWLELQQERIAAALAKRALVIERALDSLLVEREEVRRKRVAILKGIFKELKGSPRIAITMRLAAQGTIKEQLVGMLKWRLNFFYYVQYVITMSIIAWLHFAPSGSVNKQGVHGFQATSFGNDAFAGHILLQADVSNVRGD